MKTLPAFFLSESLNVAFFADSEEALPKARFLAKTGAKITIITESPALFKGTLPEANFVSSDDADTIEITLKTSDLALIAMTETKAREQAITLCKAHGIPKNVQDDTENSDFILPSILDRGDLRITVSTGGASPILARDIRSRLEGLIPQNLEHLASLAKNNRGKVKDTLPPEKRREFWQNILRGPIGELALLGEAQKAQTAFEEALEAAKTHSADKTIYPVYLIGAGPGDAELLTLKAFRLMQDADIVFHDRLVSDDVLNLVRRDAKRVSVGKTKGDHSVPQAKIHEMMIEAAKAGQRVIRLKGGDPFIFGRGGEEIEALLEAGLTCEVVPGVTAAFGAAASLKLPLTHRGAAQSVTFLTGHAINGELPDHDWQAISSENQTLIIYMGLGQAGAIETKLLEAGRASDTPIIICENATRNSQKHVKGRLDQLANLATREGFNGPALIMIGEALSDVD